MSDGRARSLRHVPALVAGRYEPVARIASGGMATVYLAKSTAGAGFEKLVALKCVHPHMAENPDFVRMFLDEARIAARIDHPNVCHVFDAGEDDGTYFIAMEYLSGESLAQVLRAWAENPPDNRIALACRLLADAAMGLHAAHELRGEDGERLALVHRDVSPQNLFVTYDGAVKVVDFGIAKARGRLHQTTTGVVRGKVAYMSPEQARAEALDARTDVWALGVTLWELLTLRRLFRRDEQLATMRALLEDEVHAPSTYAPEIPPALDRIVMGALDRDVSRRTESARVFADELNRYLASRGTHVGMSELSDCMAETFSEAIAEKEAFRRVAETTPSAVQLRAASKRAPEPKATDEGAEPDSVAAARSGEYSESIALPMRGGGNGRWLFGALAAMVGLVGGVFVVLAMLDEPAPSRPVAPDEPGRPAVADLPPPAPETSPPVATAAPLAPTERSPDEPQPAAPSPAPRVVAPRVVALRVRPAAPAPEERSAPPSSESAPPVVRPPVSPPRAVRIVHPTGGWAELRLDGQAQRNTPITLPAVRPGAHTIELRPYGSGAWIQHRVLVPPGAGAHVLRFAVPPPP